MKPYSQVEYHTHTQLGTQATHIPNWAHNYEYKHTRVQSYIISLESSFTLESFQHVQLMLHEHDPSLTTKSPIWFTLSTFLKYTIYLS